MILQLYPRMSSCFLIHRLFYIMHFLCKYMYISGIKQSVPPCSIKMTFIVTV